VNRRCCSATAQDPAIAGASKPSHKRPVSPELVIRDGGGDRQKSLTFFPSPDRFADGPTGRCTEMNRCLNLGIAKARLDVALGVVATMTAKRAIFVRADTRERERCDDRIHQIDQSLTSRNRGVVRQLTIGLHDPAVGSPHTSPNTYEFASS
jgi:hypothetical protein